MTMFTLGGKVATWALASVRVSYPRAAVVEAATGDHAIVERPLD